MMKKFALYIFILINVGFHFACAPRKSASKVYVSKDAKKTYDKAEQFVQQHFKDYLIPADILFELHIIYFNNDDQFTISNLGAYKSVKDLTDDKELLLTIANNKKESYTGYVLVRNYDLYKEIEILDENDMLLYFPDLTELQSNKRTLAYYELDAFLRKNWDTYASANNQLTLLAIPVENETLQFNKANKIGAGNSTEDILINVMKQNKPIVDNAIYVTLAPQHLLETYEVVNIQDALWSVKNYLETYKLQADVNTLLETVKLKQETLSKDFSKLNQRLQSVNDNEMILNQMLNQILNKIE